MTHEMSPALTLLRHTHPLHVVVGDDGVMSAVSSLAERLLGASTGAPWADVLTAANGTEPWPVALAEAVHRRLDLRAVIRRDLFLRGQVVPMGRGSWAVVLSPVVTELGDLKRFALCDGDLPLTDPTMDLLTSAADRAQSAKAQERKVAQEHQRQKLEVLGRLVGGISHDFNNLLVAILGHAGHAMDEAQRQCVRESLEGVIDAAERAAALTGRLLTFARPTASLRGPVDAGRELRSVAGLVRRLLRDAVSLDLVVPAGSAWVPLDRSGLEQILVNLAVNARDAMPEGGCVHVELSRKTVTSSLAATLQLTTGTYVLLTVRDSGVGMSRQVQERVFEPFFTTKPVGQGTGLGLSTLQGLVRGGGGVVRLDSELGRGTTVQVWLPEVAAPSRIVPLDALTQSAPIKRGKTVLLVDDDPRVRRVVARTLRKGGFEVCEAEDPEDARRKLPPSADLALLITDQNMPGGTGVELVAHLERVRPRCPAIVMSGFSDDPRLDEGARAGDFRLLVKPFNATQLFEAVDRTLARTELKQLGEVHLDPPTMPSWMAL
ncbi:MAG: ATP-binding protein [Myxococcota bacterium]